MPRKHREGWYKLPHKWIWKCKLCGRVFESEGEARAHYQDSCAPARCCLFCGGSMHGKNRQARYCSNSCRTMACRDRSQQEYKPC